MTEATSTRTGSRTGPAPYGWRRRDGELVEEPLTQSVVKLIMALAAEGLNDVAVAAFLNAHGIRPARATWWGSGTVRNVRVRAALVRAEATLAAVQRRQA
jgi:hypothetical protein